MVCRDVWWNLGRVPQDRQSHAQVDHALHRQDLSPLVTASGPPDRSHHADSVRYMSVDGPHSAACAPTRRAGLAPEPATAAKASRFRSSEGIHVRQAAVPGGTGDQ